MNNIIEITISQNVNFKELKKLKISNNFIKILNGLEKLKFDKIQNLYLRENGISDINILNYIKLK